MQHAAESSAVIARNARKRPAAGEHRAEKNPGKYRGLRDIASHCREQKLPGQDLNLEWLDQNQLCYQLHHRAIQTVLLFRQMICGLFLERTRQQTEIRPQSPAEPARTGVYGMDPVATTLVPRGKSGFPGGWEGDVCWKETGSRVPYGTLMLWCVVNSEAPL